MFVNRIVSVYLRLFFLGFAVWMLAFYFLISNPNVEVNAQDLPTLKTHPLPPTLAQWKDTSNSGDYFDRIEVQDVGYLIWSQFPIKVYVESSDNDESRSRQWANIVIDAIWEWNTYLPLQIVDNPEIADIKIFNKRPPLTPGKLRARSAETSYQLHQDENGTLSQSFVIWLSPMQVGKYLPAAARHEFGHALGIWGHSPEKTDVMYYSQVAEPPPISARDINTLKRIYLQATRLGVH
ncbi:MAG: matrixin family metalloprotease [Okeania sp. SIO3C4]|nr:matrixin family metalloprotease [Okeania sp. SIO3C4]